MASYLTHELRAPVTAIRLGLEILQEQLGEKLGSGERQMLSVAVRNTQRLADLVNDIMDYAKLAAGKMALRQSNCEAAGLAQEAVESLKAWADSKKIALTLKSEPGLSPVQADAGRIQQVLTNLISNALKFTPEGGSVEVSVRAGLGEAVFAVRDTGKGIPQEDLERIFEAFEQSAQNGKKAEGTGLGLTLSRAIVSLHGGRIWAESLPGRGASFFFTIPLAEALHKEQA